jgi:hypothetical protein
VAFVEQGVGDAVVGRLDDESLDAADESVGDALVLAAAGRALCAGSRPAWGCRTTCYLLGVGQETFGLTPM